MVSGMLSGTDDVAGTAQKGWRMISDTVLPLLLVHSFDSSTWLGNRRRPTDSGPQAPAAVGVVSGKVNSGRSQAKAVKL
jgi:hypothetical protein